MFVLPLFLAATTALAVPHKRFSGLTVSLNVPSSEVTSLDDLSLTAVITNTGTENVKILKYGTILDSLPTRSFVVTKDSEVVPFTGAKLSISLSDSVYTVIPAGGSVRVEHNVAGIYDFESVGAGTFSFVPITSFQVAEAEEKVTAVSALTKVEVNSATVDVTIKDVSKRELPLNKRARDICTNASQKSFIDASYTEAKQLASLSISYINSNGASDSVYRAYFGASSTSTVTGILSGVANENSSSRTLSCTDTYGVCDGNVIAYTVISTTDIYYCSIFFNEVPSTSLCSGTSVASRNVRGGTTLHELTHATGGTDDITYGCSADQALSDANSVDNADNYNCFTTQVYANEEC